MATLTEKEWQVESGLMQFDFFAELRNGVVTEVFVTVSLDGFHVTWSPLHKAGMIRVYEVSKLTNDWLRLGILVGSSFGDIEASLKSFLNDNLTFNN
jgi:hypothetical protein